jgi:flavin-dependent dehydrogenase
MERWGVLSRMVPMTCRRLAQAQLLGTPRPVPAGTTIAEPAAGPDWFAVGDAACSLDPLSSQGICQALELGTAVSEAALSRFAGSGTAAGQYEAIVRERFARYLSARFHYYHRERRWLDSTFWQRRQHSDAANAIPGPGVAE